MSIYPHTKAVTEKIPIAIKDFLGIEMYFSVWGREILPGAMEAVED